VQHRVIGDVEYTNDISIECAAPLPKQPSGNAVALPLLRRAGRSSEQTSKNSDTVRLN
jgi:hypothetical protein